jgi:HAD superfamily hydrolase (TIGR01490 family)
MKIVAAFDFDGTITNKDTLLEFITYTKGKKKLYRGLIKFLPYLILMKLKLYPNWKLKEIIFSYYFKGISLNQFNEWGENFSIKISSIIRPKAVLAIENHLKKGDSVIIISASIENWIIPWAKKIGLINVLSTKIEVDKTGKLTGKFLTKNCYGLEKVKRLIEIYPNKESFELIAYGDSNGDKELIKFADKGFYNKFK